MQNKFLFILFILFLAISCKKDDRLLENITFEKSNPSETGIHFSNTIVENDTLNYFTFPFLYLGSGVSAGDINNDGLTDLYFTGNLVPNKLYLNKGNLKFEDITEKAGVAGDNRWYSGTTMVDINNDGFLDIYLSVSGKSGNSANQLFINNGDNTFSEQAKTYGIADSGKSIQSTFFDYNNDGLLDLFVGNYPIVLVSMGNQYYKYLMDLNRYEDSGHLYKNNGNGTFTDVTDEAGVHKFGLTLGIVASDFNNDGFKDLYLSNDFNVPDYLYLNNGDGTFSEVSKDAVKHTSMFGMGIDASDFNNDGLTDLLQLDMTPGDYKRSKTNMASMRPESFYEAVDLGLHYQYMQNCLQLNNGINNNGLPFFSDISRFAGMATTDWSWGALFADFDNDGNKDVFITNGVKRDVNNNDVNVAYDNETFFGKSKNPDFNLMPSTPISNYAYKNMGDFKFSNVTTYWGLDQPGFSNGFCTADLDNDGDLDLVINNLDEPASIYMNEAQKTKNNYLKIRLIGKKDNLFAIGSKVTIETGTIKQVQELTLTRGYQSSLEPVLHFGIGTQDIIKKVSVLWPDGSQQHIENIKANQLLEIEVENTATNKTIAKASEKFKDITQESGINFIHKEDIYNDFQFEPLLPHKYSQLGPGLATGDINNDGLEDFFIGNATGSLSAMYIQKDDETFELMAGPWEQDAICEDTGALLFDADNDGDLDLYVVSGGNNKLVVKEAFQDRLYVNTPNGFIKTNTSLPKQYFSGQKVIAGDYDDDGDLDLFIGGRIDPGNYPYPAPSYLLRNDGGNDLKIKYTDVTTQIVPSLNKAGLVTSALWDDFNSDGQLDLIITGEWMPIRFFKNESGIFKEVTEQLGFSDSVGWWYSLEKADIDQDGDMDYLAGNLGLNYKYHTDSKNSFQVYANDFDENGSPDIVLSYDKHGTKLPLRGRECSSQQIPAIAQRFKTFESFANANLEDIYGQQMLDKSLHYVANTFAHHWFENLGDGKFSKHVLPNSSQFSSINNFNYFNYNNDAYPDFIASGNLYVSEVETPRNDGNIGLVLIGGPKGLTPLSAQETGLFIDGDIKNLSSIKIGKGKKSAVLIAKNNDHLKLYLIKD